MGIKPVQNQFNGGEISPLMSARFDLPVYQYSGAVMSNFIPASEGYIKRRGGTHFVASGKEEEAILFSITSNVDTAEVIINGVVQESCYCAYGDVVSYTVRAEGYLTQSGVYTIDEDTELTVNLVSNVIRHTFAVNADEAAAVMINGIARRSAEVGDGASVSWSVSKEGYQTQGGAEIVRADKSIDVDLKMRITISASPEDAVVVINGEERNYIDVEPQTFVSWSVSKEGYQTQSGSLTVTTSKSIVVSLSAQVVGQVMFDRSTAGTYNIKLEDGRYELVMCGAGGNGFNYKHNGHYRVCGGSAAAFKGIIELENGEYSLVVGGNSEFGGLLRTSAGGAAGQYTQGAGGYYTVLDANRIISYEVLANGGASGDYGSYNRCALPEPYKSSYGYGGSGIVYKTAGGPGYIRLVYLGKEA